MKYDFTACKKRLENGTVAWSLKSKILKGCVAQAYSLEDAIKELKSNEDEWIETANDYGIYVPEELI